MRGRGKRGGRETRHVVEPQIAIFRGQSGPPGKFFSLPSFPLHADRCVAASADGRTSVGKRELYYVLVDVYCCACCNVMHLQVGASLSFGPHFCEVAAAICVQEDLYSALKYTLLLISVTERAVKGIAWESVGAGEIVLVRVACVADSSHTAMPLQVRSCKRTYCRRIRPKTSSRRWPSTGTPVKTEVSRRPLTLFRGLRSKTSIGASAPPSTSSFLLIRAMATITSLPRLRLWLRPVVCDPGCPWRAA